MAPPMQNEDVGGPGNDRTSDRDSRDAPADPGREQRPSPRDAAGAHRSQTVKSPAYDECYQAIVAIWEDEGGRTLDDIALMATINSVLANRFPHFYWTGFYRVCGDRLVVGPYIGTVGCLQIEFGRGVCGTAALRRETVIAPDVNAFPGHIACDPNSKSEIVVPVFDAHDELIAVLDVDSSSLDAFDDDDRRGLEKIVALFRV